MGVFDVREWPLGTAYLIQKHITYYVGLNGACNVMLTAGSSAMRLYSTWRTLTDFTQMPGIRFYFGDERCVAPDHAESNYGMAMQTLFQKGVPAGCSVFRMESENVDQEAAAQHYENLLPSAIDVLLLGVGEDGHIASLFPHSPALHETHRCVVPVTGSKPPFQRLTITPPVIQSAREVFVLALGEQKRVVYEEALRAPSDIDAIPARLVLNRTWIFGE